MWRSLFLALGVSTFLLGGEALFITQAVLRRAEGQDGASQKTVTPAERDPWLLMATGAVVVIYSFTIPRRAGA